MGKEKNFAPDGSLVVEEWDSCPYWEAHPIPGLWTARECWFCKWADFRVDTTIHMHESVCHNARNRKEVTIGTAFWKRKADNEQTFNCGRRS